MISDYERMKPGDDKDAYGTMVAKALSSDHVVELLMESGEWDLIPTELKRKYNSKTNKRAHNLGKVEKFKKKVSPKSFAKESALSWDDERLDLMSNSVENSMFSFLGTMDSLN